MTSESESRGLGFEGCQAGSGFKRSMETPWNIKHGRNKGLANGGRVNEGGHKTLPGTGYASQYATHSRGRHNSSMDTSLTPYAAHKSSLGDESITVIMTQNTD